MRVNLLQSWWPRSDDRVHDVGQQRTLTPHASFEAVVTNRSTTMPEASVPNSVLALGPKPRLSSDQRKPRRRRKHYKVSSLRGPEYVSQVQKQAAALLYEIADACPQLVGTWIKGNELRDWYFELTANEGWEAQGWISVAKALKDWTTSQRITRNGEKLTCYKVVAVSKPLKRRAAILSRAKLVATTSEPAKDTIA